jgi:hypothetical protein
MGILNLPHLSPITGMKVSVSLFGVRVLVDSVRDLMSTGLPTTASLVVGGVADIGTRLVDVALTHNPFTAASLALSGISYTGTGVVKWMHNSHKDRAETLSLHVEGDGRCVGIHDPQIASLMQANAKQLSPESEARLLYAFDWLNQGALLVDFAGGVKMAANHLTKIIAGTAGTAVTTAVKFVSQGVTPPESDAHTTESDTSALLAASTGAAKLGTPANSLIGGSSAGSQLPLTSLLAGGSSDGLQPLPLAKGTNGDMSAALPIYGATVAGGAFTLTTFIKSHESSAMYRAALRSAKEDQEYISNMFVRVVKQCVGDNGQRPENEQRFLAHQFPDCEDSTVTATTETHINAILAGKCAPFNFEKVQQELLNKKLQNQTTTPEAASTEAPVATPTEAPAASPAVLLTASPTEVPMVTPEAAVIMPQSELAGVTNDAAPTIVPVAA